VTPVQETLFAGPKPLSPSQAEVLEAMRWMVVAGDTGDIQAALREHGIDRQTNVIAKRLCELEDRGLVERTGKHFVRRGVTRTTWRRTGR
jgi:hypothetical protein